MVWYSPLSGFTHAPPMNSSNRRWCRSSHDTASFGSSGAAPYSMVKNFSAMLTASPSDRRGQNVAPVSRPAVVRASSPALVVYAIGCRYVAE